MHSLVQLKAPGVRIDSIFDSQNGYRFCLNNGKSVSVVPDSCVTEAVPVLYLNEKNELMWSADGCLSFEKLEGLDCSLCTDESGVWIFDFMGMGTMPLTLPDGQKLEFGKKRNPDACSYSLFKSIRRHGSKGTVDFALADGSVFTLNAPFVYNPPFDDNPWDHFDKEDNVLRDYSYAGYHHGEICPPDVNTLGYTIYNICDYGAVSNDGKSDRQALVELIKDAFPDKGVSYTSDAIHLPAGDVPDARIIIYFPEGEFILFGEEDAAANNGVCRTLNFHMGHFVIKGAGHDKTRIVMDAPGAWDEDTSSGGFYSGRPMLAISSYRGIWSGCQNLIITEDLLTGTHTVPVGSTGSLKSGDWVYISAHVSDPDYARELMEGMPDVSAMSTWEIINKYVSLSEFHQVKAVEGNNVILYEPMLMGRVPASDHTVYLQNVKMLEENGVEDLCFAGHTPDPYKHHRSWLDDSGYCILNFGSSVNSWIRRCNYEDIVEGTTFYCSAACSGYDLEFNGRRGHNATRSHVSSFVLFGNIRDYTAGAIDCTTSMYNAGVDAPWTGCLHTAGVNGDSHGCVLWRNIWGYDSTFESHASQPNATLVDCCRGALVTHKFGGDSSKLPHHLGGLVLWNMDLIMPLDFTDWWSGNVYVVKPIVVGMHGVGTQTSSWRDNSQMKIIYSYGEAVNPESLYEAQLERRLGYVPAWLQEQKSSISWKY